MSLQRSAWLHAYAHAYICAQVVLDKVFKLAVLDPRMDIVITVMAEAELGFKNSKDSTLGVVVIHPSSLVPFCWSYNRLPLLTRSKGNRCCQHGDLQVTPLRTPIFCTIMLGNTK